MSSQLISRPFKDSDLDKINQINKQQHFNLGSIDNILVHEVIESDNSIVAYGIVKKMAEAIVLLDLDAPKVTRARAMSELMQTAIFAAKKAGCQQLHVFLKDERLAKTLERHYRFERCNDIILALEV